MQLTVSHFNEKVRCDAEGLLVVLDPISSAKCSLHERHKALLPHDFWERKQTP